MNTIAIVKETVQKTENHKTHNLQKFHQNDEVGITPILDTYTK